MKMTISSFAIVALIVAPAARTGSPEVQSGAALRDCDDCPEMVVIPEGDFVMGSPSSEPGRSDEEGPQRRVHVRKFAASKFDVTREQWAAFVAAKNVGTGDGCAWSGLPGAPIDELNPSATWSHLGFPQDDSHPAVCVSWYDAKDYAHWLSERTGHRYRLLTEAEWEYAARAGSTTAFPWGAVASHEHANYGADECCSALVAGRDQWMNTSPVGSFPANAFGLHDMNGNVMQWVQDCLSLSYDDHPTDGSAYEKDVVMTLTGDLAPLSGTTTCTYRIIRGGDSNNPPAFIRSAARNFAPVPGTTLRNYRSSGLGIRVARELE
jgi:formylglycine-generating enzyme required for sulfatase activity